MACKTEISWQKICKNRWIMWFGIILFIVLATVYHYSLRLGFIPNGEDLSGISYGYWMIKYGNEFSIRSFGAFVFFLVLKMCGLTYAAVRLQFTIYYFILLIIMLPLVFKKNYQEKNYLFILPLFALFMVFLRPVGGFDHWGWLGGDDFIIQWGYDYHYEPRIVAMCSILLLQLIFKYKENRSLKILFAGSIAYGIYLRNLLYLIMFIGPFIIVYILRRLRDEKKLNTFIHILLVVVGFIMLTRFLPGSLMEELWSMDSTGQYGKIYGGTNWSDIIGIPTRFAQYIRLILQFFNVRLGTIPIIGAYSIIYAIKISLIILGYIHICRIVITTIKGNSEKYGYDEIDGILAWSFLLLTIIYLFTDLGGQTFSIRYMSGLVTNMTLVLCRNIKNMDGIISYKWIMRIRHRQMVFAVFISLVCICNIEKTWEFRASDSYVDEFNSVIEYIRSNGGGYGVGRLWAGGRIAAMTEGEIEFYRSLEDVRAYHGTDAKATYMIAKYNKLESEEDWLVFDNCYDYWELCEKYTEPSNVIEYEHFSLLVWDDGIGEQN